jgi:hypothetical protein
LSVLVIGFLRYFHGYFSLLCVCDAPLNIARARSNSLLKIVEGYTSGA